MLGLKCATARTVWTRRAVAPYPFWKGQVLGRRSAAYRIPPGHEPHGAPPFSPGLGFARRLSRGLARVARYRETTGHF